MLGKKNDLVTQEQSPAMMIQAALKGGADLEKLQGLLDLQMKWEANEAKKAYARAMAEFKAEPPEILKTAQVEYKRKDGRVTRYNHAVLDEIAAAVNVGLSTHGLYARWDMKQPDVNTVEVTCILTHELGHSESTSMKAPPDNSDGKNAIQAISSTNTYLERITLLAITGLAAKGMDNDTQGDVEYISTDQQIVINDLIKEKKADKAKFLTWLQVKSVDEITITNYNKAVKALKEKK